MIGGVWFGETRELIDVLRPGELASVHDRTGDDRSVATKELRRRVHHDVGAVLERTNQVGARDCVVDDEGNAVLVGHSRDAFDVQDVDLRVSNCFAEESLGVWANRLLPGVEVILVLHKGDLDADLGQRVLEQVVGSAINRGGAHNVVARMRDVQNRVGGRCLTRREQEGSGATLEGRNPLLRNVLRGVHDAGVNVSEFCQRKKVRGVLGAVEDIRGRAIDRCRARLGGRVRLGTCVDLLCFKLPVLGHGVSHFCSAEARSGRPHDRTRRRTASPRRVTRGNTELSAQRLLHQDDADPALKLVSHFAHAASFNEPELLVQGE